MTGRPPWEDYADFSDVSGGGSSSAQPSSRGPWEDFQPAPSPYAQALGGAQTIGATPWYNQGAGALVGMRGSGPSFMDAIGVLPAAGGAIGGAIGGAGGTAFGLGFSGVPGAVGGATLGGGAGEALRKNIATAIGAYDPETSGEAAADIGKEALLQGASELGARGVAKGLEKVAAPFAKSADQPVIDAATRQGVTMPAAATSTSKVPALLEGAASKGFGGGEVSARIAKANEELVRIADNTVRQASEHTNPTDMGKAIASGSAHYKAAFQALKNKLYKEATLPEKGMKFQAAQTVAILDDIIKNKESAGSILTEGPTADAKFYQGLLDGLTKTVEGSGGKPVRVLKDVEAKAVLDAKRELQAKIQGSFADPIATANKASLKKIAATMDDELRAAIEQQAPDLAAKLRTADDAYKEGIGKINSAFGKRIFKLAKEGQYDQISQAVANSRMSVEDIPKIMEIAGPEGTNGIRATVLADMFSKSKSLTGEGFKPLALNQQIKTFGEGRLKALLTPEQFATLKDLGNLSASMQKTAKITEGSQTAHLLRYKGNPVLVAFRTLMGDVPFNAFIGSKAGQQWLTTGLKLPKSAVTAIRTGAHATTYRPYDDEQAQERGGF